KIHGIIGFCWAGLLRMTANRGGRNRNRTDDSQLDFLALVFQSSASTTPAEEAASALESGSPQSNLPQDARPLSKAEEVDLSSERISSGDTAPSLKTIEPPKPRNSHNLRILDSHQIGSGSKKSKCRGNLAAITLLKIIEAEDRPANNEEKNVLVRYVG